MKLDVRTYGPDLRGAASRIAAAVSMIALIGVFFPGCSPGSLSSVNAGRLADENVVPHESGDAIGKTDPREDQIPSAKTGNFSISQLIADADQHGTPIDFHGRPVPFTDDQEAFVAFAELCASCHAPGKPVAASWGFPDPSRLDLETLENLERIEVAYQAMLKKYLGVKGSSPSPMPNSSLSSAARSKLGQLISWMQDKLPSAVARAEAVYPLKAPFQSDRRIVINYQCKSVLRGPSLLSRFVGTVLGRTVTRSDEEFFDGLLRQAVKQELSGDQGSLFIVSELSKKAFDPEDEWFSDLMSENGALMKFARKVASVGALSQADLSPILPDGINSKALKVDLQQEFFQMLKKKVTEMPYRDVLLHHGVMVTKNTAPLYENCDPPADDEEWKECTLSPARGNFFGTRGFLLAKPSSFLTSNNNYGRGGDLYSVLSGTVLMANTDGDPGLVSEDLPACMNTQDMRWRVSQDDPQKKAPWGALSVPAYGKVCQACHLDRKLAAASYVFRPFGLFGEQIAAEHLLEDAMALSQDPIPEAPADRPNYRAELIDALTAHNPEIQNLTDNIPEEVAEKVESSELTVDTYIRMLEEPSMLSASMCSPDTRDPEVEVSVRDMRQLVEESIGDGQILVEGFSRFFASAFLNTGKVSSESRELLSDAFLEGEGMLLPVMQRYFSSRTFICGVEEEHVEAK